MTSRRIDQSWCAARWLIAGAVIASAALALGLEAQEAGVEPPPPDEETVKPWSNEAEASYVKTGGNSSASTLALSNRFAYNLTYSELLFTVDFMRASTTTTRRSNVGGELLEESETAASAERYQVAGSYRQNILDNMFWYARSSWYRNPFAGISAEVNAGGGIGYRFIETPDDLLVGEIGFGVTNESLTNDTSSTFVDIRGALEGRFKITDTTGFEVALVASDDLQNTTNLRATVDAAISVAVSNALALRVGYLLDYRNEPVVDVLEGGDGVPPVIYTRDKSDSMFLVSLVVKF
jgi:putative salt-induced outer membrane protein YdiY